MKFLLPVLLMSVFCSCAPTSSNALSNDSSDRTSEAEAVIRIINNLVEETNIANFIDGDFSLNSVSLEANIIDDTWVVEHEDFILGVSFNGLIATNLYNEAQRERLITTQNILRDIQASGEIKDANTNEVSRLASSYNFPILPITVNPNTIQLSIRNKTNDNMAIVWDESTFMARDGSSNPIVHAGIPYQQASESKPDSIIPSSERLDDVIINANAVSNRSGNWGVGALFSPTDFTTSPSSISALLTLKIGEDKRLFAMNFTTKLVTEQ